MKTNDKHLGKYDRKIGAVCDSDGNRTDIYVDVYDVLKAFSVTCPASAHGLKKLLAAGLRGTKSKEVDLREAQLSIERAIQLNLEDDNDENGEST